MSSIYKKGRDGYYYYQAYVYNPATKKKDKRIFRALRTKDLDKAEKIKKILDAEISDSSSEHNDKVRTKNNNKKFRIIKFCVYALVAVLIIINVRKKILTNNIRTKNQSKKNNIELFVEPNSTGSYGAIAEKKNIKDSLNEMSTLSQLPEISKEGPLESENILLPIEESSTLNKKDSNMLQVNINVIPKYDIKRVEKLSGTFKQGKIYVIVKESSTVRGREKICEEIFKKYSKFENIVICLYANTDAGIKLSSGLKNELSIEDQRSAWIGLYTFNSVEGPYYDDNPSNYLGSY